MEEKKVTKISLSTYLLVIAIFAIVVMGALIYKLNNDKNTEIKKSANLQAQVSSLNNTVTELQGTINNISNVINNENENTSKTNENTVSQKNSSEKNNNTVNQKSNSEKSSSSTSSASVSNSSKDSVNNKILGTWKAFKVVDSNGNDIGLRSVWGSGIEYSNEMIFKENDVLLYMIGITASNDDGKYIVNGNTIQYGVPTDIKGKFTWKTLTYIPEEDILKEELNNWAEEKQIITYIRAN